MSLEKVLADIEHVRKVRYIDEYEAKRMTAPSSDMGLVMDYAEHSAVKDLYQDVVDGRLSASNEAKWILKDAVEKGPNLISNVLEWTGGCGVATAVIVGVYSLIGLSVTWPIALVSISVGAIGGLVAGFFMD